MIIFYEIITGIFLFGKNITFSALINLFYSCKGNFESFYNQFSVLIC